MKSEKIAIKELNIAKTVITVEALPGASLITQRLPKDVVVGFRPDLPINKNKSLVKDKKRDPDEEFESCFHFTADGQYGYPSSAFYGAIMFTCTDLSVNKTELKRSVRLLGDVLPLRYSEVRRREDIVNDGGRNRTPNIRFRPEFLDWECDLNIQYDADLIELDTIVNLINRAGFAAGVGAWRPSSPRNPGQHGTFSVKTTN
jgi:hypothetical protein